MTVMSYSEVLKAARQLPLEDQVEMVGELLQNLRFTLQSKLTDGDVVVSMGAGDIWKVADEYIQRLGRNS